MARKTTKSSRRDYPSIPESFQPIVATKTAKGDLPTLVLRGEWLKAAGFPIGTCAYLLCDATGEIALHRLGLRFPRRLIVRAKKG